MAKRALLPIRFVSPAGILCLAFLFLSSAAGQDAELLKIESSISPKRLSRGEGGKVVLKLGIQPGIRLSSQPSLTIEFTPIPELVFPKDFFTASDLGVEVLEEGNERYLNLKAPLELPFTVSPDAKPGSHILEGKVRYFARSQKEGWCYKSNSKFSVSFSTRQSVFRKKQPAASRSGRS